MEDKSANPRRRLIVAAGALGLLALLAWSLLPAIRAFTLVYNGAARGTPDAAQATAAGLHVQNISFAASDGVRLRGWLAVASPHAPTIILAHGFKGTRVSMLPWARVLSAAGYKVLLFDDRGYGQSDGWGIGLGATEPNDVGGAARYLESPSAATERG